MNSILECSWNNEYFGSLAKLVKLNIECWLGSFVIFQGIWTSIAKKPYSFVIFLCVGYGPPVTPCGSAHDDIKFELYFTLSKEYDSISA